MVGYHLIFKVLIYNYKNKVNKQYQIIKIDFDN